MRAHRTDLVSLLFGLLFVGLSLWWLLAQILGLALPPVGWFLAGALLLIGLLGLVGALRSGRHDRRGRPAATGTDLPAAEPAGGDVHHAGDRSGPDPTRLDEPDIDPAGGGDVTTADIRVAGPAEPSAPIWAPDGTGERGPRPDPYRTAPDGADEWPTGAAVDRPGEAVEDRVADAPEQGPPSTR
ncbi:hypothetical protein E1193_29720 [Micromonospora sp. KC606]|uniref:hypothetical protein n=1 Tax=Micromonospora sp. KC606 TaxID=2530379 RepID=UPI001045EC51|nr:hypothetical protein [Micromonospora sp. KC606]TDC70608.1 hypothetical protein E1193_29720 [Micromonospora sp. KC606]